jgi:GTP cyclohydrolase I
LTKQVAEHLESQLSPRGVGVVIEAEHTCMSLRGAKADGTRTVTSALFGQLRDDPATRAEFLGLTRKARSRA